MVYGKSDTMDVDRLIDMLQALEKFVAIKEQGDGTSYKVTIIFGFNTLVEALLFETLSLWLPIVTD